MANNMKTDIELLSELLGRSVENLSDRLQMEIITPKNALAALAEKEKQIQGEIDRLRNQLSDLSDEYELNLCKKCLHPKAMLCPGEYQCVNKDCV